jgi:CheY-like chemotaxis protein
MIKKVLCIDDDQITLVLCELVIKKTNFANEVIKVNNGKEGLAWFSSFLSKESALEKQEAPEMIFLDLTMPVMNGWDFLEEYVMKYSDRLPTTKVVIVSSTVNPEDFSRANNYDIVIDFISKPLTEEGLHELMTNEHLTSFFESV